MSVLEFGFCPISDDSETFPKGGKGDLCDTRGGLGVRGSVFLLLEAPERDSTRFLDKRRLGTVDGLPVPAEASEERRPQLESSLPSKNLTYYRRIDGETHLTISKLPVPWTPTYSEQVSPGASV